MRNPGKSTKQGPSRTMGAVEVLLVEDNAGDAIMIRRALYECPVPVNLHVARDGEQALLTLTKPHIPLDLIVLDLNIPKITGTALLQRWQFKAIPVVVFSSSTNPTEKERCLALGAREFVSKPTDLDEFNETVCRIVDEWAMPWEVSSVL
jgi:CheY-like chemotaxis protein